MELKPGYKQTEVGVIPSDWDVIKLGSLGSIQRGASPRPIDSPIWFDNQSNTGWLRISDVTRACKYLTDTIQNLSSLGILNSRLVEKENLVMSICATVGRPIITKKDVCIHDGFVVFNNLKISKEYLYYVLIDIEKNWSKHGQTGSQMNLNTGLINLTSIPLPPTKAEQTAIANALNDADALIQSLTRLIAKKRQIKQGTMQTLLNPYENGRLKAGWVVKKLGNILRVCHGKSQHEVADKNGKYPILATSGEIGRASKYLYDKPSVLIGRKGTIDVPRYMEYPFWSIDTLFYTEIFEPNNAKYLFYQFNLIDWYSFNEASGVPSLSARTIENIEISLPSPEKQVQIANLLSDMDAEIAALEAKLAKYQRIKQGMMQNLLTGKIRLI